MIGEYLGIFLSNSTSHAIYKSNITFMEEFHNLWKCLRHVLQIFVECYKSKKLGVPHIVASNGGNVLNVLT